MSENDRRMLESFPVTQRFNINDNITIQSGPNIIKAINRLTGRLLWFKKVEGPGGTCCVTAITGSSCGTRVAYTEADSAVKYDAIHFLDAQTGRTEYCSNISQAAANETISQDKHLIDFLERAQGKNQGLKGLLSQFWDTWE